MTRCNVNYYVYMYLRTDGSPYYVGKGKESRWKSKNHRVEVPPPDRVIFPVTQTTEEWAHFMEMELIDHLGRLNDGTGILENFTDGGEGSSGAIRSEETKQKLRVPKSSTHKRNLSISRKGISPWNKGKICNRGYVRPTHTIAMRGEANPKSKLKEKDVTTIRIRKQNGEHRLTVYKDYTYIQLGSFTNTWYGYNWKHIAI